jgi:molecular chaperone GrpE
MAKKKAENQSEKKTDKPSFEDMFIEDSEDDVAEDNIEHPIDDPEDDFDQLTQTEAFSRSELEEMHKKEKEAQLQETEDAKANSKEEVKDNKSSKKAKEAPKENGSIIKQIEDMRKKMEAIKAEADDAKAEAKANWEDALRVKADAENFKRRAEIDADKARKFAIEKTLNSLFPVVDSLEKALEVQGDSKELKSMREGVEMTYKMLVDALTKAGLEQLDPAGKKFDPTHHEAMGMVPDDKVAANDVIQVIQKGYVLNGRLVRPARVIVSSGKA